MAATEATANRAIVSRILQHLFDAEFTKILVQSPGRPVELLECGPSLLSPLVVNRLWADVATSVLWKSHPPIEAFTAVCPDRRQYYASKVEEISIIDSTPGSADDPGHLEGLQWPNLKSLEACIDWHFLSTTLGNMLHPGLLHLELAGAQDGGSAHIAEVVFPALLGPCTNLQRLHVRPDTIDPEEAINARVLEDLLDYMPCIKDVRIRMANFFGKDRFFVYLSQRTGLEVLKIDLDPGLQLLPLFSGHDALPSAFSSLKRLHIMCDPEIALALPTYFGHLEELQMDIERVPDAHIQETDLIIVDAILTALSGCTDLLCLKVNVGNLAIGFPSAVLNLPLNGSALIKLANNCPKLRMIDLAALEPSTIDGSGVSSAHFDEFCAGLPCLMNLRLKLHPGTATILQTSALPSLAKHCPRLEVVRMGIPLQLPHLLENAAKMFAPDNDMKLTTVPTDKRNVFTLRVTDTSAASYISPSDTTPPTHILPLFPNVTHLAFARPETSLATAMPRRVSDETEEATVRSWATAFATQFPQLEVLEAWGDSTGQDREVLPYLLPLEEELATTWEFLSGAEQNIWERHNDGDNEEVMLALGGEEDGYHSDCDVPSGQARFDGLASPDDWAKASPNDWAKASPNDWEKASPNDWEKASFMNEFPEVGDADSGYQEYYDDEVR